MKTKEMNIRGITLIALVVTIVVLLILAGTAIAMLTGDNSTIENANKAKDDTEIAEEKEILTVSAVQAAGKDTLGNITEENLEEELTNNIGERDVAYELTGTGPFVVKYLDSERSYLVDENGNVSEYVDLLEYLKVGDYVNYNPTIKDLSGTHIEVEKLKYTSPKGDGQNHGNGNSTQTFTATASTKWRVLEIGSGTLTLISEKVIKTDTGGNFILHGAPGYLYAEQELNEICKIYGYGYGADTSQVTEYSYGGPEDGELTGQIIGTGARSIKIEDINKYAGIEEDENGILRFSDGTIVNSNYGSTTNPTQDIYYPTITKPNGNSGVRGVKNLKYTFYDYDKSKITSSEVQDMLADGNYWLASRGVSTGIDNAFFSVRSMIKGGVQGRGICRGLSFSSDLSENTDNIFAVRPLVTLKSEVLDIDAGYNKANGGWQLK